MNPRTSNSERNEISENAQINTSPTQVSSSNLVQQSLTQLKHMQPQQQRRDTPKRLAALKNVTNNKTNGLHQLAPTKKSRAGRKPLPRDENGQIIRP
jgi:hypothetical protein